MVKYWGKEKESAKSKCLYTPWAMHGPCHVYLCVCFSQYRHVICQRHRDCHRITPLSLNNDDDDHKQRTPPHTTPRNRRTTGDSDTTTAHNTKSRGFCEKQGGPNESFGPRYVFFFFFLSFFCTNMYIFYILCVIRPTDPPSLQERVGGPFLHIIRPTDPPSLQERVGGPLLPLFYTNGPTLATNASRWAVFHIIRPTDPPSLQERVGGPFLHVIWPTDPPSLQTRAGGPYLHVQTPPSLQTRVGGVFSTHMAHPRCKRESVGRCHTTTHPQTPPSLQMRVGRGFIHFYYYYLYLTLRASARRVNLVSI